MTTDIEYVELQGKLDAAEARLAKIAEIVGEYPERCVDEMPIKKRDWEQIHALAHYEMVKVRIADEAARVAAGESVCDQTPTPGIPQPGSKPPF